MIIDEKNPGTEQTPVEGETPKAEENVSTTTDEVAENTPADGGEPRPRRRGFAAMDRTRVKEIASKGGKAAHAAGTAHQFSSDEARVAGRKGGMAPHARRGGVRRRTDSNPGTAQGSGQGQGQNDGR